MNDSPLNRTFSRRALLGTAAASAAALALAACAPTSTTASSPSPKKTGITKKKLTVTMFTFAGGAFETMPKEFATDYMERHPNVTVNFYPSSNALGYPKMVAQRQVDPSNPLVNFGFFNAQTRQEGANDRMWLKLDYKSMSNAGDIYPSMTPDDGYGIGIASEQLGLLYNTQNAPAPLASWTDFLKPAYKGQLVTFTNAWWMVFMAAKAHGGSLKNMEPGWKLYEEAAKSGQFKLIVSGATDYLNALSNGTASVTSYYAGTAQQWINGGAPLKWVEPKEGAVPQPNYLSVVDGGTDDQKEVAIDMINELISPKWCGAWSEASIELPANSKTKLSGDIAALPQFQSSAAKKLVDMDWATIGASIPTWSQTWATRVAANI